MPSDSPWVQQEAQCHATAALGGPREPVPARPAPGAAALLPELDSSRQGATPGQGARCGLAASDYQSYRHRGSFWGAQAPQEAGSQGTRMQAGSMA